MEYDKLDKKSRDMLAYLNANADLSSATLAEVFNQHYITNMREAIETLSFLESKNLIRLKISNDETLVIIEITHLGRTYEQILDMQEKERKKKIWAERRWNILTLILSAIVSVIVSLIMGGKT